MADGMTQNRMRISFKSFLFLFLLLRKLAYCETEDEESCVDIDGKLVDHGLYFVPGPNVCTQCVCHHSEPMWCQTMFCNGPPYMCLNYKVGKTCCQFECLDPPTEKPLISARNSSHHYSSAAQLCIFMVLARSFLV